MKKLLLLIAFAFAAISAQAQEVNMGFIPPYHPGYSIFNIENAFQQSDGNIVSNVLVGTLNGNNPIVEGNIFYKASFDELQYTDSLFVADSLPPYYLFAKDPGGTGNLRVNIEPDGYGGTALRISHFPDDDLNIDPAEDLVIHLCDTIAFDHFNSYMIDSRNDLIIKYYTQSSDGSFVCHIARVGLDGTIKHTAMLPQNQNFLITMDEFESASKQYYQWKNSDEQNLFIYLLDSTFQMKNSYVINKQLYYKFYADPYYAEVMSSFSFGSDNFNSTFVIPDGEDIVVAAPYNYDSAWVHDFHECGAAVARYELRTMQRKALKYFNDQPGPSTGVNIMCFQKTSDGNLYLVFREPMPNNNPTMSVVKLDWDLNVIWRRFCYEQSYKYDPYIGMFSGMLNDNEGNETGIYIVGYAANLMQAGSGIFHFFLTDEGLSTIQEGNIDIRPYAYYPNPTQDRLRLQYSPDVQPKQVELYDLQGRLVRSHSQGLESVDMQGLASGQYLMKVTLENGKSFTDKVVKE